MIQFISSLRILTNPLFKWQVLYSILTKFGMAYQILVVLNYVRYLAEIV